MTPELHVLESNTCNYPCNYPWVSNMGKNIFISIACEKSLWAAGSGYSSEDVFDKFALAVLRTISHNNLQLVNCGSPPKFLLVKYIVNEPKLEKKNVLFEVKFNCCIYRRLEWLLCVDAGLFFCWSFWAQQTSSGCLFWWLFEIPEWKHASENVTTNWPLRVDLPTGPWSKLVELFL